MWYQTTFVVRGAMAFPLDMLRRDSCFPCTTEDVNQIDGATETSGLRDVTLMAYHRGGAAPLALDRWQSFGWRVVSTNTRKA